MQLFDYNFLVGIFNENIFFACKICSGGYGFGGGGKILSVMNTLEKRSKFFQQWQLFFNMKKLTPYLHFANVLSMQFHIFKEILMGGRNCLLNHSMPDEKSPQSPDRGLFS
ncbi:hypothetical protein [Geoalkalibacter halelectricus]|uniref:hypothetical protein n=1 Tax=Geoalkalibacter halelectricus TaxID=2847045 RepID=UPI003D1E1BBA